MKIMNKTTQRNFDGTVSGAMSDGEGMPIRMSADLSLCRDTDGSWLAYVVLGDGIDDVSKELKISDPQACQAFDALFELIADPIQFDGRSVARPDAQEVA